MRYVYRPVAAIALSFPLFVTGCDSPTRSEHPLHDAFPVASADVHHPRGVVASVRAERDTIRVAGGAATIAIRDLLANDGDVRPDTFELVSTWSARGGTVSISGEDVVYTAAPSIQEWDYFEYHVCDTADVTLCSTGRVMLILEGTGACSNIALEEQFVSTTAPDWHFHQSEPGKESATLTAATAVDDDGYGWLRLTSSSGYQTGAVLFDVPFSSEQGTSMSFDVATWGGTGANTAESQTGGDGFTFFLVDGDEISAANFAPGKFGGSLGYANRGPDANGMPHGVLAVGFDEFGNFWNGLEGKIGPAPGTPPPNPPPVRHQLLPNSIVIRGNAADGWAHVIDTGIISPNQLRMACPAVSPDHPNGCNARPETLGRGRYRATVNLVPVPGSPNTYEVSVYTLDNEQAGFGQRLHTRVTTSVPQNLKLGFAASTGSATNHHEIRNLRVAAPADLKMTASGDNGASNQFVVNGQELTYTFVISNKLSETVCASDVELQLPAGFTPTAQSCTADSASHCGGLDSLGTITDTIAVGPNGTVTVTVTGTINTAGQHKIVAAARVTPTAGQGDIHPLDNFDSVEFEVAQGPIVRDHVVDVGAGVDAIADLLLNAVPGSHSIAPESIAIQGPLPHGAGVIVHAPGSVTISTSPTQVDDFTFTYTVADERGVVSARATVTVRVNDRPIIVGNVTSVEPGTTATITSTIGHGTKGALDNASMTIVTSGDALGQCHHTAGTASVRFDAAQSAVAGTYAICRVTVCETSPVRMCESADFRFNVVAPAVGPTPDDQEIWTHVGVPVTTVPPFLTPVDAENLTAGTSPNATVTIAPDGQMTVSPAPGFAGVITVPVTGCTTTHRRVCTEGTITVVANDLPTIANAGTHVVPGQHAALLPHSSPGDVGTIATSSLAIAAHTSTTEGLCVIRDGRVHFTAYASATVGQTDTCFVTICEEKPANTCATGAFTFTIVDAFRPTDDRFSTHENTALDVGSHDLLANDGAADPSSITIVGTADEEGAFTTEKGGILVPNEAGDGFVYTPPVDFVGEDGFAYVVCAQRDPSNCETVFVTLAVLDTPVIEDTTRWVVVGTDHVDVDMTDLYTGDPGYTLTVVSTGPSTPAGGTPGTATVDGSTVRFTPTDPDAPMTYEVVVETCDTETPPACAIATITIVYNDPPTTGTLEPAVEDGTSVTMSVDDILLGTSSGVIDGGLDLTSLGVSATPHGPFGDDAALPGGATCAWTNDGFVYTSDTSADRAPCYVQVCEQLPGPLGRDATDRACGVIAVTPARITTPTDPSPDELILTGGRLFGCSQSGEAPWSGTTLALVGLGALLLQRRRPQHEQRPTR